MVTRNSEKTVEQARNQPSILNRRNLLQTMATGAGATIVGFAGTARGLSDAGMSVTSFNYIEVVRTHQVSDGFVGNHVDCGPFRLVDEGEKILFLPYLTSEQKVLFSENDTIIFGNTDVAPPGKIYTRKEPYSIRIETDDEIEISRLPIGGPYSTPSLSVRKSQPTVFLSGENSVEISPGEERSMKLNSSKTSIKEKYKHRIKDRSGEMAESEESVQIEVRPEFHIKHYGELEVRTEEVR